MCAWNSLVFESICLSIYIHIHYCIYKYKFKWYTLQITLYSSFPFFTLWLYSLLLSAFQSKLIRRKSITVTTARKMSTFLGKFSCSTCSNFHISLWHSSSTVGFDYVSIYCLNGTKCTYSSPVWSPVVTSFIRLQCLCLASVC
jgi:hypothetical protein